MRGPYRTAPPVEPTRRTLDTLAGDLCRLAQAGGGTLNPRTGEQPTAGYVVALYPGDDMALGACTPFTLALARAFAWATEAEWIGNDPETAERNAHRYLGVWCDSTTGRTVLDVVEVFPATDEGFAAGVEAGKARRQDAIFGLHNSSEVPLADL